MQTKVYLNETKLINVEERVKNVLVEHMDINVEAEKIDPTEEFFLDAYGFNSVDALELLLRIEQEFDIEISDERLNADLLKTVRCISEYVLSQLDAE